MPRDTVSRTENVERNGGQCPSLPSPVSRYWRVVVSAVGVCASVYVSGDTLVCLCLIFGDTLVSVP